MTPLTEKQHIPDYSTDGLGSRELLQDVTIDTDLADRAWAVIQRMCPDDADTIGRMVGVTV